MPVMLLKKFLDENGVRYETRVHPTAYTAQEVAHAAHVPGKQLAKTVMVKLDGELAMAVLPANERVDLAALARESGHQTAELATEAEFGTRFPGCEVGSMPPFGNLWQIPVYASETLMEDEMITFSAGGHGEVISLSFQDYRRLVEPRFLHFGKQETRRAA